MNEDQSISWTSEEFEGWMRDGKIPQELLGPSPSQREALCRWLIANKANLKPVNPNPEGMPYSIKLQMPMESQDELQIIDNKTGDVVNVLHRAEDISLCDGVNLKIMSKEKADWETALAPIKGFNVEQLELLKQSIASGNSASVQRIDIVNAIQSILDQTSNKDTFAIPSHPLMFSLLAMFAGKPERIPRELLDKPHNERTPEEKEQAERYLNNIFETKEEVDYSDGIKKTSEKRIALICNNARVEGKAEISWSLFQHCPSFREERLAQYIKRTFGPEGIRHLLGLIIGLEENFRKGHFEWSVNEHLERLGHRKKTYGSFDPDLKKTASEIIKIFTGLCITGIRKDGKNESIKAKFLFMVEGFEVQTFEKEIIDQRITLVATDFWYKNAFSPSDGQAAQYTKLLKEIVKENHREHPFTLYLTPLFAIFWRISPERKFKVRTLMEWCDLDSSGKYKSKHLKDLEATLEYMKQKNYLGEWINDGEAKLPSDCRDPYECVLTFTPPDWLKQEFLKIHQKRETPALSKKQKPLTRSEFLNIIEISGLSRGQFANSIGVSSRLITAIINGKRSITADTSDKIRQFESQRIGTSGNKTLPS